ncbi:MAG: tetratricopeptide repeat protein, partial [Woeseiaceae bacterium]
MALFSELRRRNVLRMAVLYAVSAWLIMQVVGVLMDLAKPPDWIGTATLAVLAIGFPIVLVFSWFYELTPEGISLEEGVDRPEAVVRDAGRRFDVIVISLLSAAVVLFAIDKWWMGPPTDKSIAVLAFENMSADPEQEYFSDGIAEELLNALAQVPELRVISRSSSFSFKDKDVAVPAVAEALNVAYVLEGSVRKDADQVRITAQLIEAGTDFHVWSETYDREIDGIFDVQDEIAVAITDALKMELAIVEGELQQPSVIKAASTDAYDAYLEARELIHRRGVDNIYAAIDRLQHALNLDADFAPAHAQLAIANVLLFSDGEFAHEDAATRAIPHLDLAQELEPDLAEAHGGRAVLALSVDPESAAEHARKALSINPNYADAAYWLFLALRSLGRHVEANAILDQQLIMDPLSVVGRLANAYLLIEKGQIEEAREIVDQFVAEDPGRGNYLHVEISLYHEGDLTDALYRTLTADDLGEFRFVVFMYLREYDEARRASSLTNPWL